MYAKLSSVQISYIYLVKEIQPHLTLTSIMLEMQGSFSITNILITIRVGSFDSQLAFLHGYRPKLAKSTFQARS